ncbi:MAG: hypothetical protein Kow0069_25130 [Promethearchaeota archaeon]
MDVVVVTIRKGKNVSERRSKTLKSGVKEIRAREPEGKFFLHAYEIPFKNLGVPPDVKPKELLRHLNSPTGGDRFTRDLLAQLLRDYDEILFDSRRKVTFKTKRFKKRKSFMQMKRKTL